MTWITSLLAQAADVMNVEAVEGGANFQPYIFWAYGLACFLLLAFTVWTSTQMRSVGERLEHLERRLAETKSSES